MDGHSLQQNIRTFFFYILHCPDAGLTDIQHNLGQAVNNLVKHFYKPEKEVNVSFDLIFFFFQYEINY